jgi:hypothetical protein
MANKKFNIKNAAGRVLPAMAGGVAVGYIVKMLADKVPDAKIAAFIPLAAGAYLAAIDSGKMGDAGLGMVGAASSNFLLALGVPIGAAMPQDKGYFSTEEVDDFEDEIMRGSEDISEDYSDSDDAVFGADDMEDDMEDDF